MDILKRTDSRRAATRTRHTVMTTVFALALPLTLAACSGEKTPTPMPSDGGSVYEVAGDHAIGNAEALVTVTEYASVTCGHCANWHTTVYPDFKKKYIDTGKVRYIFREFPTPPETLARTGFLIANCADEQKFFENISLQFKRQKQIFQAAGSGRAREEYVNIAKSAGLSEEEFISCLTDEAENAKYEAVVQNGIDAGVNSTPSFFINGVQTSQAPDGKQLFTIESFDAVILPMLGETVPDAEAETETESGAE